ncbi:MAG: Glutamyl-tRNA synthetase, partial [Candidatus Collierbacteria bacterium GW2011_GWA2_44_99]
TLKEFSPAVDYFFNLPEVNLQSVLEQSGHSEPETKVWFNKAITTISELSVIPTEVEESHSNTVFTSANLHDELAKAQQASGFSPREAFMSLRVAISGRLVTPPLFDCLVILGKEETLRRLSTVFV